jgi:hypothetical protein
MAVSDNLCLVLANCVQLVLIVGTPMTVECR